MRDFIHIDYLSKLLIRSLSQTSSLHQKLLVMDNSNAGGRDKAMAPASSQWSADEPPPNTRHSAGLSPLGCRISGAALHQFLLPIYPWITRIINANQPLLRSPLRSPLSISLVVPVFADSMVAGSRLLRGKT